MRKGWMHTDNGAGQEKFAPKTLAEAVYLDEGEQKNAGQLLGQLTGQNLLDNAYFPTAINQRGLTQYPSATWLYTIDRWRIHGAGYVEVTSAGIVLHRTGDWCLFVQFLELPKSLRIGQTYTFTAVIDGEYITATGTVDANQYTKVTYFSNDGGYIDIVQEGVYLTVQIVLSTLSAVTITRAKLEKGSISTLAQDPIPASMGPTLAACQRYYIAFSAWQHATFLYGWGGLLAYIPTPVTMRGPSPVYTGEPLSVFDTDGAWHNVTYNGVTVEPGCLRVSLTGYTPINNNSDLILRGLGGFDGDLR